MKINTFPDYQLMSVKVVDFVTDFIHSNPRSLLCFAGGNTPALIYRMLVSAADSKQVNFQDCKFVGLDEWVGIAPTVQGSCRYFLDHELFQPLGIRKENICFFNGNAADLQEECRKINAWVGQYGPVGLMLLGIGVNGHLGFNEPGTSFDSLAHPVQLQEITCKVGRKYFKEAQNLSMGITLGLRQITESHTVVLVASGPQKSVIVKKFMDCEINEGLPASILKAHPDCQVFLDKDASRELDKS